MKVVARPSQPEELRFDIILPSGHVKEIALDRYQLKAYRGLGITEIIAEVVLDFLPTAGYTEEECKLTSIVFI